MSYFKCPDCGNIHYIYGKSKIDEVAAANDIKTVAKIPMDAKVAGLVDSGTITIDEFCKRYNEKIDFI